MSQPSITKPQDVTPPPSIVEPPLTPPLSDKKPVADAHRVIALFRDIQAGTHTERDNNIKFQLAKGEFDQIQSALLQDGPLLHFVEDKIRYDYDEALDLLVVRMPTKVHEIVVDEVEDDIRRQLQAIRNKPGRTAQFAQNIRSTRSIDICFDTSQSKNTPDISFGHNDARFPGLIVEVAFSQEYKNLRRLAENYLLYSYANVRVVVGIKIEYGKTSRKAALSIWRPKLCETPSGYVLEAQEEVADEVFRDDQGDPVEHTGLRLHLSDFAFKDIAQEEMGDEDAEIHISGTQLCRYIATAEAYVQRAMREASRPDGIKIRERSISPLEELGSEDEARYVEQEKRTAKRVDDEDVDYGHE